MIYATPNHLPSVEMVKNLLTIDAANQVVWKATGRSAVVKDIWDQPIAVALGHYVVHVDDIRRVLEYGSYPKQRRREPDLLTREYMKAWTLMERAQARAELERSMAGQHTTHQRRAMKA
jgi:hypothetical protein